MSDERIVKCPRCGARLGTTPDGQSLRAGKGLVLQGKAAALHLSAGLIPAEVEGYGAVDVGCLGCGATVYVAEALSAQAVG